MVDTITFVSVNRPDFLTSTPDSSFAAAVIVTPALVADPPDKVYAPMPVTSVDEPPPPPFGGAAGAPFGIAAVVPAGALLAVPLLAVVLAADPHAASSIAAARVLVMIVVRVRVLMVRLVSKCGRRTGRGAGL